MKTPLKIIIAAAVIVAVIAIIAVLVYFFYPKAYAKDIEKVTVGDGESVKIGILSDTQLPAKGGDSAQAEKLEKSLRLLKERGAQVLIYAGDFTDLGTEEAWSTFKEKYDLVYGEDKPVPVFVLGNHDYWLGQFFWNFEIPTPAKMQKRFTKYTGEMPFSHKEVNGYHFIAWSSANGSYDKSYTNEEWIRGELDKAAAASPDKPIFVVTHLNPTDTVYGSDDWGNDDIYNILKDYPQVISFSGHSHYSLLDERSMWQGEFTAINTQAIDYIELEEGKFNGSIPVDAYGNSTADKTPTVMMATAEKGKVTIDRISVMTGEKLKDSWVIKTPADKADFLYTNEKRIAANKAPAFAGEIDGKITAAKDNDGNDIRVLSFNAASDDDFVHSYAVEFYDGEGKKLSFGKTDYSGNPAGKKDEKIDRILYFTSYTLGLDKMPAREELRMVKNVPENAEYIKVYAIDSWGAESEPREIKLG